ncbi:MAG: YdcF family protein, partial [Acidobacteriia bacterium]|nr:YdcF family protein [Terriglobia bacterium]
MKRAVWNAFAILATAALVAIAYLSVRIERQSSRDEAQPADVILVLGAAEYRGRPSPVLRARLDHALELYNRNLAPRILTTGGAGGDPVFTEGGVGRSYLIGRGVPSEVIIVETEGES